MFDYFTPGTITIFVIMVYFFPWLVAKIRKTTVSDGVLVINIFLGWTFIGWVVALAWAAAAAPKPIASKV